ncbi:MAG: sensor histidine kinase, partial [Gemmataceae bacterium]
SINTLLDLDLAIIEDAYQTEYMTRLQRTERLVTIGQVAGGIAHELRNPLNVVKTSVYYLLNARNPTPEKTSEHLRRIERHVVLADSVITALSNFARLPTPQQEACPAAACVQEALEMSSPPEQVKVNLDCPPEVPPLLVDGSQIRIVVANLIRNACDAMPEGGNLGIRARAENGTVILDVSDSGVGIAREDLARIMEPLYSTKTRGLGLGLAIARAILDKNRGSLEVSSTPGQGSTFTIRVPAAPREVQQ